MKLISWNTNGIRACLNKGFMDFFEHLDADIFCIQETKMQEGQASIVTPNHKQYWHSAEKKGYSGTAIFTKKEPLDVHYGINGQHIDEGRVLTLSFDTFYLVNCYSPNAQRDLKRIDYRMQFENDLRHYLVELNTTKPVIFCGDLNVAHQEIDLKNPKANIGNAGFSNEEREKFSELLNSGFIDSFRFLHPDVEDAYTWWSYRFSARERNIGWRIDYFLISNSLQQQLIDSTIYPHVLGSDHCPIGIEMNI